MTIGGFLRSALAAVIRRPKSEPSAALAAREARAIEAVETVFTPVVPTSVEPTAATGPASPVPVGAPDDGSQPPSAALTDFVASVRHLPLFTGTAMQLMRSVGQEDVTSAELSRLISTDAGLVAHLLRIANSPYYGLAQRLGTVGEALAVLGFNQVRRTVTAAVLQRPLMTYLHDTKIVRAFWRHELMCAALARHVASTKGADGELAYMAGLMHDIGRLAMLMEFPQHTEVLLRAGDDEDDDLGLDFDRERAEFGFDHAQVGGALLAFWGLPPAIVQAALHHADIAEPGDPIGASVWRANVLSHEMERDSADPDTEQAWMTSIGLDVPTAQRMRAEIAALESAAG